MARVFISHASDDREPTDEVHRLLVAEGHEVFLDRDLRNGMVVGEEWEQRLLERLRWADAVVCVVTSAFLASEWCPYEVGYARSRGSRLLPVLAEPGVDHPLVKSAHHADLTDDPAAGRAALVEALRRIDAAGSWGWPDGRSPFPGLRALDVEDHRVFFGRGQEVNQLAMLLRSPAERAEATVLLVVGPSGCGKSSLVRAGLLPVMANEPGWWTLPPMLPGTEPVAALARELAVAARQLGLGWTVAQVRHQLEDTGLPGLADELLLATRARRLLLVVDQFEELLTQIGPGERAHFAQLLRPALGGPLQVVATLRPEFFDQLLGDTELAGLPTRPYPLRPLHREALRTVIEGPAQLAGIEVDEELVTRLVADTDSGEALPLLAFTLAQLAEGVGRGDQLSGARYEQLGGVQGALRSQADAALADAVAATGRSRTEVIAGLLRLITVDEQGRPTRWRVPRAQLPEPVTRELDAFVTRRLLTTDTHNGSVVVGVAHEAFLSAWAPLAQAIAENATALRARRAVEQAATEWDDEGRTAVRLWERGQLAAAVADTGAHLRSGDLATDHVDLSSTARVFLRASIRRDRIRRGRALTVLSVLLVLALVAAGIAVTQQRAAEQQRNVALSRQVAGKALELRATNPALAAYRLVHSAETRSSLLSIAATPYATRLTGHTDTVYSAAFSPDGRALATASADNTTRLWNISDPHHPSQLSSLTGHTNGVRLVAFSPDRRTLATASGDGTVRLWDVGEPRHPHFLSSLTGHTNTVESVALSPDGHTLATGSDDTTARLWEVSDPHQPHPLSTFTGHTNTVVSAAFSPDGRTLATTSDDTSTLLWDLPGPIVAGHTNTVYSVAFSPDGRTLATTSRDTTARLWEVSDPRQASPLGKLTGHNDTVYSVAFSLDGRTLATASRDRTLRLWSVGDPRQLRPLKTFAGQTGALWSVALSADGHTLATGSADKTVRLWDTSDPLQPQPLKTLTGHHDDVRSVGFSPDGLTLATGSDDNTTRLWDVSDPHQPHLLTALTGHTSGVRSVAFSPDGHTLATGSDDKTVRLWDLSSPHQPHLLTALTGHTSGVSSVAFSPNRHTLATASTDKTVRLWDLSNPHQPHLLGILTGHIDVVTSVAFSRDGHTLATGSYDNTARLWETDVDKVVNRTCATAWPVITRSEWDQYLPGLPYQPPCR